MNCNSESEVVLSKMSRCRSVVILFERPSKKKKKKMKIEGRSVAAEFALKVVQTVTQNQQRLCNGKSTYGQFFQIFRVFVVSAECNQSW